MADMEKKYEFIWKIEDFNPCLPEIGNKVIDSKCFASPNFKFYILGYTEWYIELYPKTGRDNTFIKCLPICNEYSKDCTIDCELSILNDNGSVHTTKKVKCKCSGVFHCDFSNALELERSKLPLQKDLIIRCILSYNGCESEAQTVFNDSKSLSRDMLSFYSSRFLSDVTLRRGNDKLYVHRTILCIRAPKLAEDLDLLDENNFKSIIDVRNIPMNVLKVLMQYIYTGIIDCSIDDILDGLREAAKKYNLQHLKYELSNVETYSAANTKIISNKELFTWKINNITSMKIPAKKLIDLQLSRFWVTLTPQPSKEFQLTFKILKFPENKEVYLRCKVNAVDNKGNLVLGSHHIHLFEDDTITKKLNLPSKETWNYPTLMKLINLKKNNCVSNGSVSLQLELELSEGKKTSEVTEKKSYFKERSQHIVHIDYLSNDFLDIFKARNRPCVGGEYYEGDCYNDIALTAENESVHCHKSILCARSPIFAKLFNTQNETIIDKIEIPGVDLDIVRLMVQYVYSGLTTNLAALEMAKLYIAAEKYHMWSLAKESLDMLEKALSVYNFCDVLLLGETLQIEKLLKAVCKFVKLNKREALNSSEWQLLVDKEPVLTSRVFLKMFEKQERPRVYYGGSTRRKD